MKAVVCYGNNDIRYEEVPDIFPQKDEVKIRVKACGICGSDLPRALKSSAHNYPVILGHEFSGVIEEIGSDVQSFNVGDRVTAAPLLPCMNCEWCDNGDYALCSEYSFIGSSKQGAMAEYVNVPAKNIIKLPDDMSFEQGSLFEPATVALHAFKRLNYKSDGNVAVLGGGTIGIFVMQWAKILGCKQVVVFGRDKQHLELAKRFGADYVISTLDEDFIEKAISVTDGKMFNYVFESAGAVETVKYSLKLASKTAKILIIGTLNQNITFTPADWNLINRKELSINGSWMSYSSPFPGKEWELTKEYFEKGALIFDENMFYKKFDIKNAGDAFNLFTNTQEKIKGRVLLKV